MYSTDAPIRRVGVVGAGTMGKGIATLVAGAGVPVSLLDVRRPRVPEDAPAGLIETGTVDSGLARLARCDLIVEAIVEDADAKRALFTRLEPVRQGGAIVATNTSSIPVHALAEGRSRSFQGHFLGVHFFNPVAVMRLVEVIPTAETHLEVVDAATRFARDVLGKGVVAARDAPGFIANRLGVFVTVETLRLTTAMGLSIEAVDALTGPLLGRPTSATFRTADLVGLDVTARVARELNAATGEDFALPDWVERLVAEGRLGVKTGSGYYRRDAARGILALDPATLEYRPLQPLALEDLKAALALPLPERLRAALALPGVHGEFVRRLLAATWRYALKVAPEIADDAASIDRAMEWGRGWEMGPFGMMEVVGEDVVRELLDDDN